MYIVNNAICALEAVESQALLSSAIFLHRIRQQSYTNTCKVCPFRLSVDSVLPWDRCWLRTMLCRAGWPASSQYVAPWIIIPRRNNVGVKIAAAVTPHEPKPLKRAAQCVVLHCVAGRRRGPVWTRLKSAQRVSFGNGLAERLSARSDLRIDIAEGRLSAVQLNVLWNVVAIHHSRQTCPAAINAHALCAPRFIAAVFIVAPIA